MAQIEENWDHMDEEPYVPQLENRAVIKKVPARSSKSAKRAFYEQEKIRWAKIKEEQKKKLK